MAELARTTWKIAVTGSASVGKTSLVKLLSTALGLPCIDEEMRAYLERTHARLAELPSAQVTAVLIDLWRERAEKEASTAAFVADNCCLDFVAYALHYGCLTESVASFLLPEVLEMTARYDALFVLPWGVLPYVNDGVRSPGRYSQLGYQLTLEGLIRRHLDPGKVHYLPEGLNDLPSRSRWVCSVLDRRSERKRKSAGVVILR